MYYHTEHDEKTNYNNIILFGYFFGAPLKVTPRAIVHSIRPLNINLIQWWVQGETIWRFFSLLISKHNHYTIL